MRLIPLSALVPVVLRLLQGDSDRRELPSGPDTIISYCPLGATKLLSADNSVEGHTIAEDGAKVQTDSNVESLQTFLAV